MKGEQEEGFGAGGQERKKMGLGLEGKKTGLGRRSLGSTWIRVEGGKETGLRTGGRKIKRVV